jgi:predicted outer membrane lipoprotein
LTKGFFPAAQLATGFVAVMLGLLVALTFGILFAEKLEVKE